jgi:hypothetical protein
MAMSHVKKAPWFEVADEQNMRIAAWKSYASGESWLDDQSLLTADLKDSESPEDCAQVENERSHP